MNGMPGSRRSLRVIASSLMLTALVVLAGCATTIGTKVDERDLAFLVKLKTKKSDVISKLGTPEAVSRNSSGGESLHWSYAKATQNAQTYIPIVGLFASNGTVEYQSIVCEFDRKGILLDFEVMTGSSNARNSGTK